MNVRAEIKRAVPGATEKEVQQAVELVLQGYQVEQVADAIKQARADRLEMRIAYNIERRGGDMAPFKKRPRFPTRRSR